MFGLLTDFTAYMYVGWCFCFGCFFLFVFCMFALWFNMFLAVE